MRQEPKFRLGITNMQNAFTKRLSPVATLAKLGTLASALTLATMSFAAQDVVFTNTAGTVLGATQAAAPGTPITLVGRYSVNGSQTGNEAGLGIKVKYDASKFSSVVVTSFAQKCAIAPPQVQSNGAASQVVAGWIETSKRAGGAVGWPVTADIAGADGCLAVAGVTDDDAAKTLPFELFRYTFTPVAGYGTAAIQLVSEGNISYANGGNADINKTLTLTQAAAAACNLDVDANGAVTPFRDGIMILRSMLGLTGASVTQGLAGAPDPAVVGPRVAAILPSLDVDGNGAVTPFRDGLILLRITLGLNGAALTQGLATGGATRTTSAQLIGYVNTTCGTSYTP
jgi:hypothetical protein